MKQILPSLLLAAALGLSMTSCYTMTHTVGQGASTEETATERQWYLFWGLLKLNDVDSHEMADGADNYTVKTEQSFLDIVINIFTGLATIHSREITVTK